MIPKQVVPVTTPDGVMHVLGFSYIHAVLNADIFIKSVTSAYKRDSAPPQVLIFSIPDADDTMRLSWP